MRSAMAGMARVTAAAGAMAWLKNNNGGRQAMLANGGAKMAGGMA